MTGGNQEHCHRISIHIRIVCYTSLLTTISSLVNNISTCIDSVFVL